MSTSEFSIVFAVFPGVTQLDFTGPHQVLSRLPGARLCLAGTCGDTVESEDGLRFAKVMKLADIECCDVLCVPGGPGTTDAALDQVFIAEIRRLAGTARYVTSVCTGSLILAAAGLLRGRDAACHWAWRELLTPFGARPVSARVVRDGNIITGGGVTAGIDFALSVAQEVAGPTVAQAIQLALEYAPEPPFNAGGPETAPAEVRALVERRLAASREKRQRDVALAAARLEEKT
ncbi:MAG: DJ-1/PfpI family protein [Ectothiorhodospiraceae bacterium]|nr:DJ-1/PfpI family protein [Ectothiorhodospiraceae bacterium]